jgi:hypothetical protein
MRIGGTSPDAMHARASPIGAHASPEAQSASELQAKFVPVRSGEEHPKISAVPPKRAK